MLHAPQRFQEHHTGTREKGRRKQTVSVPANSKVTCLVRANIGRTLYVSKPMPNWVIVHKNDKRIFHQIYEDPTSKKVKTFSESLKDSLTTIMSVYKIFN